MLRHYDVHHRPMFDPADPEAASSWGVVGRSWQPNTLRIMVVEFLTFTVPVAELARWLEVEERNWSRFLERQDGFVRKEMWRAHDDPEEIHAVIWWETLEQWHAVPAADLQRVVEAMGPHERSATCAAFDVVRES